MTQGSQSDWEPGDLKAMRRQFNTLKIGVLVAVFAWVALGTPGLGSVISDPRTPIGSGTLEKSVHYPSCDAARASGAAPIEAGQPGYRAELDGDGNGVACEAAARGF